MGPYQRPVSTEATWRSGFHYAPPQKPVLVRSLGTHGVRTPQRHVVWCLRRCGRGWDGPGPWTGGGRRRRSWHTSPVYVSREGLSGETWGSGSRPDRITESEVTGRPSLSPPTTDSQMSKRTSRRPDDRDLEGSVGSTYVQPLPPGRRTCGVSEG